jgi:glycosyltransferase involved in cell wall biosynthesis
LLRRHSTANAFERLLEYNINSQTYYNIKEIIILDDSDIDRPLCIRSVIPIRYYTLPRMTIGMKRNCGVKLAQGEYVAFIDDDDFYHLNIFLILFLKWRQIIKPLLVVLI